MKLGELLQTLSKDGNLKAISKDSTFTYSDRVVRLNACTSAASELAVLLRAGISTELSVDEIKWVRECFTNFLEGCNERERKSGLVLDYRFLKEFGVDFFLNFEDLDSLIEGGSDSLIHRAVITAALSSYYDIDRETFALILSYSIGDLLS